MARNVKRPVSFDTTGFISDRFAKIAATYTGGYTRIVYASSVCTNVGGLITLPAEMKAVAQGIYTGPDADEKEKLAMSYVNHEMGHDDVELRLKQARGRREKVRCSNELYLMVPPELRSIAIQPGDRIILTSEWLKALPAYGSHIAIAYGGSGGSATKQLQTLTNAAEDPRQEHLVGTRWAGAREHLLFGNEYSLAKWKARADELRLTGQDHSFLIFAIGMVYELHGNEQPFGETVQAQIDACADLISMFKAADWRSAHGFYDSVNFALACLGRVYRREIATDPPKPTCSACNSENLKGTLRRGTITIICLDCGHREEQDVEEGSGPGEESAESMEMDSDETPEGAEGEESAEESTDADASADADDADDSDSEGDEKGSDGDEEAEGDEDASEGSDESDEASDGSESAEDGDDEDGDDADGTDGDDASGDDADSGDSGDAQENTIEVGAIVRIKATGEKGKVTALYDDGTFEVEPVAA
jgi:hypothetical protein